MPRDDGTLDHILPTVFQQRDHRGAGAHLLVLFNKVCRLGFQVDYAVVELYILF